MAKLHTGLLIERVTFQKRTEMDDGAGNTIGDWNAGFDRPAGYLMKPGSEAVLASRLAGEQPITIFTYWDSETSQIKGGGGWRVLDKTDGTVFAIHAAADMDRKRQWMTMVCEAGVEA